MYSDEESSTVHGGCSLICSGFASIGLARIEQGEAEGIARLWCCHPEPPERRRRSRSRGGRRRISSYAALAEARGIQRRWGSLRSFALRRSVASRLPTEPALSAVEGAASG